MSPAPTIADIVRAEVAEAEGRIADILAEIRDRHHGVLAFLYYGSSLRDLNDPSKMLDFYALVSDYRAVHRSRRRAWLNHTIPPAVYYLKTRHANGAVSETKYSIISLSDFERRAAAGFLSQIWGRFSQPSLLLSPLNDEVADRVFAAREAAIRKIAAETQGLFPMPISARDFWARAFHESYRTELRPESSVCKSAEIVDIAPDRYDAIMTDLYGRPRDDTYATPPGPNRWRLRRWVGKPMTAIRVVNSAATFEGGLDYVLSKLERHSGVTIEPTAAQRRHPVLWSPVLGWKLWRRGAFR